MPVTINISGADAAEAMRELRDFSAPFHLHTPVRVLPSAISAADAEALSQRDNAPLVVEPEAALPDATPKRDAHDLPWDERIHSANRALNADGTWRKRRGVADELVKTVEAELRSPTPIAQPVTAESVAPEPIAEDNPEDQAQDAEDEQAEADAEDSPEDQAQDAEDEQAEADAVREDRLAKDPDQVLTHDDVRNALGLYVRKYGMPAAQEDGPALLKLLYPSGGVSKISDIPDAQEDLAKVIAGVNEMLTKNPYKREKVA